MTLDHLKSYADRFLRGPFNERAHSDLMHLFLGLREKSYGCDAIREVGDFVAHRNERVKGLATASARDFFAAAQFSIPLGGKLNLSKLPPHFIEAMRSNFRRCNDGTLESETGLKRKEIKRIIDEIEKVVVIDEAGFGCFRGKPTNSQWSVIQILVGLITASPAFTEAQLFSEFKTVVLKNKLVTTDDLDKLSLSSATIALFALSMMHKCKIKN